jgi:hypothetical protein
VRNSKLFISKVVLGSVFIGAFAPLAFAMNDPRDRKVEDIYVARSVNESKTEPATEFCSESRTGYAKPLFEEQYSFLATSGRGSDGLVTSVRGKKIGHVRGCFGATNNPDVLSYYAEGNLSNVSFKGHGECRTAKHDFPEKGVNVMRCFLEFNDLKDGYIGGQLTTNTIHSRKGGLFSEPVGYTQSSIATIRVWKAH